MNASLRLSLDEVGADRARLEVLHRQLRDELWHADALEVAVLPAESGAAPDGTRALGPAEIGALAVAVLGSGGLPTLLASLRGWLRRGAPSERSVRLEIDGDVIVLEDADDLERHQLLQVFLDRHGIQGSA